jgi:hypothetical protein
MAILTEGHRLARSVTSRRHQLVLWLVYLHFVIHELVFCQRREETESDTDETYNVPSRNYDKQLSLKPLVVPLKKVYIIIENNKGYENFFFGTFSTKLAFFRMCWP